MLCSLLPQIEMPGPLTSEMQTNYFWLGKVSQIASYVDKVVFLTPNPTLYRQANYTAGVSDTIRDLTDTKCGYWTMTCRTDIQSVEVHPFSIFQTSTTRTKSTGNPIRSSGA